jgi:hypothetical protein
MGPLRRSNAGSKRQRQRPDEPGLGGGYCALLEVRRCVIADDGKHIVARKAVFAKLGLLVETQRLIYPKEVWDELKVGNAKLKDPTQDLAFDFAERYKEMAAMSADWTIVHVFMADTLVRRVIDPDS